MLEKEVYGREDHPERVDTVEMLGLVRRDVGDEEAMNEAETLLKWVLEVKGGWYGEGHREVEFAREALEDLKGKREGREVDCKDAFGVRLGNKTG